jgi:predicted GIY-YIG superfamily endonuclease
MLRDELLARMQELGEEPGETPDYQRLAAEVLRIRGATPELARILVNQALVVGDRFAAWRRAGARIAAGAPPRPGVYILRDDRGHVLYVGKAVHLRRRLQAHFAGRRWRGLKPVMSRVADAEWIEVGSELEALLREAALIRELRPIANVQTGPRLPAARAVPRRLVRDLIVIVPSVELDSAELIAARLDGGSFIQRTRRSGVDLAVHVRRLRRFFRSGALVTRPCAGEEPDLAPLVFSWLAGRGASATRLDPHDVGAPAELRARLARVLRDDRLFLERIDQRSVLG